MSVHKFFLALSVPFGVFPSATACCHLHRTEGRTFEARFSFDAGKDEKDEEKLTDLQPHEETRLEL